MHVHIVINSARKYEGRKEKWHDKPCEWKQGCKHKSTGKMMHHAKKWVMESCIRRGFGQVDLLTKKHRDNYWVEKRLMNKNSSDGVGVTSNRELIRNTIDKMLPAVDSFEQMVECLKGIYGWNIRVTDKTVTFATSDMKKGIRGNKLGDGYGKAELVERIAQIVTEREAANEARRIAEEEARAKAEAAAREETIRKKKQLEEERKQAEILSRKRKLAYERNNIQHEYYSAELDRPDWNREYIEYLETQFIRNATSLSEEELTAPIITREEFEKEQAIALYREKADQAGVLWDKALSELSSVTHTWKWEYMDYLEAIRFKDLSTITLCDAKEEILSYEEFAGIKEATIKEKEQEQTGEVFSVEKMGNTIINKTVEEKVVEPTPVDFTKLTIEERAAILPVPTDDIKAEYDAYCERMGYTVENIKSIQYKMFLYDEFMEEYETRKKWCGTEKGRDFEQHKERGRR